MAPPLAPKSPIGRRVRDVCGTAALFGLLAVAITWPLARHIGTAIPGGGAGDNVTFVWHFWWMRKALSDPALHVWWTNYLFFPVGTSLILDTYTALNAFVGAVVLRPFSVIAAQNLVILGSVALNGWCTCLLIRSITGEWRGALVGGLLFASCPYFSAHLIGHFNLIAAWPLPLFAWFWRGALAGRTVYAMAAGVVLALTGYLDAYYVVYLVIFSVITTLVDLVAVSVRRQPRVRPAPWIDRWLVILAALLLAAVVMIRLTGGTVVTLRGVKVSATTGVNLLTVLWIVGLVWTWRQLRPAWSIHAMAGRSRTAGVQRLLAMLVTAAIGLTPLIAGAVALLRRGDYVSQRYFWRSAPEGVDLAAFVLPSPSHPIWGTAMNHVYSTFAMNPVESVAWIGFTAPVLLALSRRWWVDLPESRRWLWVAGVFGAWSLGPYLRVGGVNVGLWLPEVLLRFVPIAANARIPGRAMVMVYLAMAVLVGVALARVPWRRRTAWSALASAVVCLEFVSLPLPLWVPPASLVYQALASEPPGAVLDLPLGIRDGFGEAGALDHEGLYYQSVHGHPIVSGFVARMGASTRRAYDEDPVLRRLLDLSAGATPDAPVDESSIRRFAAARGIHYVVVDRRRCPTVLATLASRLGPVIRADPDRILYSLE